MTDVAREPEESRGQAWHDSDDDALEVDLSAPKRPLESALGEERVSGVEYQKRLRLLHRAAHGESEWLQKARVAAAAKGDSSESDEDGGDHPLQMSKRIVGSGGQGGALPEGDLEFGRLPTANSSAGNRGGVGILHFLRGTRKPRLVVGGSSDPNLRLFDIDGGKNSLAASVPLGTSDRPWGGAQCAPGEMLVLGFADTVFRVDFKREQSTKLSILGPPRRGQRFVGVHCRTPAAEKGDDPTFSLLDQNGGIYLCDLRTHRTVQQMKMTGGGVGAAFHHTLDILYSADTDGNVYQWDRRSARPVQSIRPSTGFKMSQMAVSPLLHESALLAIGSESGFVDLFDIQPSGAVGGLLKSLGHLTTRVDAVQFHPEGQILGAASGAERGAVRLVHLESRTVFRNFPDTRRNPVASVRALSFSPREGLLAAGDTRGVAHLFRLHHFCD